jgi:hypothetical protein
MPEFFIRVSTKVVLPWSTWAIMAIFRKMVGDSELRTFRIDSSYLMVFEPSAREQKGEIWGRRKVVQSFEILRMKIWI